MLGQRVQVWKAEARSVIAERSASLSAARVENSPGRERLQITARTIAKRKALVKDYRDRRELSATALARAASMSDTTIRGIVNEDWKRFSASSQRSLLDLLRLTEAEWYQE